MSRHASNRARIQRMAAEADATQREKEEAKEAKALAKKASPKKKAAKKKTRKRRVRVTKVVPRRKKAAQGRVKIVWIVCDPSGATLRVHPHREKADAEAEVKRLSEETGHTHMLRSDRVPMKDDE